MKHSRARRRPLAASLLTGCAAALLSWHAAAATLKPYVVVQGDAVRLGDIFEGAGRKGETALFRAPEPGQSVMLTGKWLREVARTHGLEWRPVPGLDTSLVERSSNVVRPDRIRAALHAALAKRIGPPKKFEVALDNPTIELHLPVRMPAEVTVRQLQLDPSSNRFAATLVAPDDRPGAAVAPVAGRIYELVEVPVPTRRIRAGETIGRDDVTLQSMRAEAVSQNVLTSLDHVVGKSARHSLLDGRPLNGSDVREPQLVQRGGIVTMTYRTDNLVITAHGKARENGTAGQVVQVQNLNSGKIVEAVVTGHDTVAVQPLSLAAARCAECR